MRRVVSTIAVSVLIAAIAAPSASAAEETFSDIAALVAFADNCDDGDTAVLGSDVGDGSGVLSIDCDLTIDLAGFTLDTSRVEVGSGHTLTLNDSGSGGKLIADGKALDKAGIQLSTGATLIINAGIITAQGGREGAGIGGGRGGDGGTVVINGGTVDARGGEYGAGIGGGWTGGVLGGGNGGITTITGGTVTATGGDYAAGIGGGRSGDGGTTTISGGTVTAVGGLLSAGIGGGPGAVGGTPGKGGDGGTTDILAGTVVAIGGESGAGVGGGVFGEGGTTHIGEDAMVTATPGTGASAIGAGEHRYSANITLAGSLTIPSGELRVADESSGSFTMTITSTGQLLGSGPDPTTGFAIVGNGSLTNDGVIALAAQYIADDVTVDHHNYLVTFDAQGDTDPDPVRVFADSFTNGHRVLPNPPADHYWTADPVGNGAAFATDSPLTSDITLVATEPLDDLFAIASTCADGDTYTLNRDLGDGTVALDINCDLTIDLAGFTLDTSHVTISSGNTLTLNDSGTGGELIADGEEMNNAGIGVPADAAFIINAGTVTATGGIWGAGIGGSRAVGTGEGGTVTIAGGTVIATGGINAAGIGGGDQGAGGTITIAGGTVTATSNNNAAGIGGGYGADGGTITIAGGTVTATGLNGGAGIGGGYDGTGGDVAIAGGTVTASGGSWAAGIGGGLRGGGGDVAIGEDAYVVATGGFSSSAVGAGEDSDEFGSLTFAGTLRIPTGTLRVPDSNIFGAEVVITATGQLLGTEADPTVGATITGAGQIDNHGIIAIERGAVGSDVTVNHHNYELTFHTGDEPSPEAVHVFAPNAAAGYRLLPDPPADTLWNTAPDRSGDWFTHTTPISADITLYAVPDIALNLSVPATSVNQGDSLTFEVTATDHTGATVNIDPTEVVLTSDVATDIIDGLTITFPTASPHTITATLGLASASVTIEVIPTAVPEEPEPTPTPTPTPAPAPAPAPVEPTPPENIGPENTAPDQLAPAVDAEQGQQLATTGTSPATSAIGLIAALLMAAGMLAVLGFRRSSQT